MNYSVTYAGAIAMFLSFLAKIFKVELPYTTDQISSALITVIGVIGFLVTIIGRYRHGDITIFGTKKSGPEVLTKVD